MGRLGVDNECRCESVMVRNPGSDTRDGGNILIRGRSFINHPGVLVMRRKEVKKQKKQLLWGVGVQMQQVAVFICI